MTQSACDERLQLSQGRGGRTGSRVGRLERWDCFRPARQPQQAQRVWFGTGSRGLGVQASGRRYAGP